MGIIFLLSVFGLASCINQKQNSFDCTLTPEGYVIHRVTVHNKEIVFPGTYNDRNVVGIEDCYISFRTEVTKITISKGIQWIYNSFNGDNHTIQEIIISKSVESISQSFSGCHNLKKISVDQDNPKFDSRNNCQAIVETSSNMIILGCSSTIIPDSIESIGESAFCELESLEEISIPGNVKTICGSAFEGCYNLKSVTLSEGVLRIGAWAFKNCSQLNSIVIPSSVIEIGDCAFDGCPATIEYSK